MRICSISLGKKGQVWKLGFQLAVSAAVIVLALALFVYPAITICAVVMDPQLRQTGESRFVPEWFESAAPRFISWANMYLDTNYGQSVSHDNIPATEWPMFGAVFVLVTAEDLQRQGKIDARRGTVREAVDKAAEIVASPATGTWVKTKWGDGYREKENVFYRMLLILGLSSYETITGNTQYREMMSHQRLTLADELAGAKLHLRDDYPGECYPADMLWAVAAIQRAARLENTRHDELAASLIAAFDGPLKAPEGLPAFQANSRSGLMIQGRAVVPTRAYSCLPPNWTRRSRGVGTRPTKKTTGKTPAGSPASGRCPANGTATSWTLTRGRWCSGSDRWRRPSALGRPRPSDGSTTRRR